MSDASWNRGIIQREREVVFTEERSPEFRPIKGEIGWIHQNSSTGPSEFFTRPESSSVCRVHASLVITQARFPPFLLAWQPLSAGPVDSREKSGRA